MRLTSLLLGASLLLLPGCGGGGGGGSRSSSIPVIITPASAFLAPSATQQFSGTIPHVLFSALAWSVREGAAGGTVDQTGLYQAPALAGTYHVVATGVTYSNAVGVATVVVHVIVQITPHQAGVNLGQNQQFTATVIGAPTTGVKWTVLEGNAGGTITSGGLYTAPATPGQFHIVATSTLDPTESDTAIVDVQSGSASGTIQ